MATESTAVSHRSSSQSEKATEKYETRSWSQPLWQVWGRGRRRKDGDGDGE